MRAAIFIRVVALALCGLCFVGVASRAQAQVVAGEQVDADFEGKLGMGLLGAELGLFVPALVGIDNTWLLLGFSVVGGAGGAIAGHFLIDQNNSVELGLGVLAAGVALVIPTLVITTSLTQYDPEDDTEGEEVQELSQADTGLIRTTPQSLALGAPALGIVPSYTREEQRALGIKQQTEWRLPVVSGRF